MVAEKNNYHGGPVSPDIPANQTIQHADGLAKHNLGRLRDRQWYWSSIQHSGVPLLPAWQHLWAGAVLGEPRSCHGK